MRFERFYDASKDRVETQQTPIVQLRSNPPELSRQQPRKDLIDLTGEVKEPKIEKKQHD